MLKFVLGVPAQIHGPGYLYIAAGAAYLDNDYDLAKRIGNGDTLSIDGKTINKQFLVKRAV